jgi:hypothetical protein
VAARLSCRWSGPGCAGEVRLLVSHCRFDPIVSRTTVGAAVVSGMTAEGVIPSILDPCLCSCERMMAAGWLQLAA